jgi:hypothetical protein
MGWLMEGGIEEPDGSVTVIGGKLHQMAGIASVAKGPQRIAVAVTPEEFTEFQELAQRCSSSISALGQLAIRNMLVQARAGALPMLPPSRVETAIPMTCFGDTLDPRFAVSG